LHKFTLATVLLFILLPLDLAVGQETFTFKTEEPDWSLLLPEGGGKAFIERVCLGCHDLRVILAQRQDSAGWESIINRMASEGAEVYTEEQREVLTEYLSQHFGPNSPRLDLPLELNTASVEQLERLPEVSRKEAEEIVKYREQSGGFASSEEVKKILGSLKFEKTKNFVTVRESSR